MKFGKYLRRICYVIAKKKTTIDMNAKSVNSDLNCYVCFMQKVLSTVYLSVSLP